MLASALISLVTVWGAVQCSTALHCLPGDSACAKCQASCDSIDLGALPECCEVYSACCPTYSRQCQSCEPNTAVDPHFPEYCCASFTDCCHLVPGLSLSPAFSARQPAQSSGKDEGRSLGPLVAAPGAGHQTSQLQEAVVSSPTTLHTTSISKATQNVAVQNAPPAARGTFVPNSASSPVSAGHLDPAPAGHPNPAPAGPPSPQPRTRQRSAVAAPSSGAGRPAPAPRRATEAANISRRGRVTSRGRVAQ